MTAPGVPAATEGGKTVAEMYMELADCQNTILAEIGNPAFKRADVASTYGLCLMSSERNRIDWKAVNEAIVKRWSRSALTWIKTRAWKMAEGKQTPEPHR